MDIVYPADASLIVSLLDIHVSPPGGTSQGPVEILEAGTGHGSLTLHLARAVHAANTAPPFLPPRQRPSDPSKAKENVEGPALELELGADDAAALRAWREQRGAIVHTVDVSTGYSVHAESIVRGFRRGMYAGDVDFYVSPVEKWIEEQVQRRGSDKPFLQYAILDLPGAQDRIPHVSPILKEDGVLAVFMPSITQIGECLQLVNELRLPLILEKAVELGTGISSGRLWDVRSATIRKPSLEPRVSHTDAGEKVEEAEEAQEPGPEEDAEAENTSAPKGKSVLVCRPKVGERIVGGGFVGIWRKIKL
ncbi:hypothetical protein KEM55_004292 [Ascosphaera atra]|nr:hypothetical protein KEM55_004292 [Ascosphaera atra]